MCGGTASPGPGTGGSLVCCGDGQVATAAGAPGEASTAPRGQGAGPRAPHSGQESGEQRQGVSRGVGDQAGLTGRSLRQQRPPERHLGHQGEPVKQRGQEHPEHPGRQHWGTRALQVPVFTDKRWLAFPAA